MDCGTRGRPWSSWGVRRFRLSRSSQQGSGDAACWSSWGFVGTVMGVGHHSPVVQVLALTGSNYDQILSFFNYYYYYYL
jgi:hypothetical protein